MTERLKDDTAIVYVPKFREYGVSVLDGGTSFVAIQFCPWCGTLLPASLREKWFASVEDRGFAPDDLNIPREFLSDLWWRTLPS